MNQRIILDIIIINPAAIIVVNYYIYDTMKNFSGGCPYGVMVNVLDCEIVVSEFELQSNYYVRFQIPWGKVWNPYPPKVSWRL